MYPGVHAATTPDKPALIMGGTGEVVTYRELDERSNQLARLWRDHGLGPGDHVAIFSENNARFLEVMWAALRSGLYITTINSYLSAEEVAYILDDSGSRSLVTTTAKADVAAEALRDAPNVSLPLLIGDPDPRFEPYVDAISAMSTERLDDEQAGEMMLYSSGTTGRPKGIKRPLSGKKVDEGMLIAGLLGGVFGANADTTYLSPAPLYHSAPIGFNLGVQSMGGTTVIMEKFDPVDALRLIEEHRATLSQWVPTMFVRMLKLPVEERERFDLSSMQVAIHAAAPCPVEVKQQMMDWWGPVLWEYYAGTELNGFCLVKPEEWLERPGTVGKPLIGEIHILDEEGNELPAGEAGTIYFGGGPPYEYHNAPDKTEGSKDPKGHGWTTLGDVGYLDEDGWLFLTDRKAFMIISGGVNIYPQEIEDCLIMHPKVADVAVFGIPDDEMGESVMAAVQLAEGVEPGEDLEAELRAFTREHIAGYKCPKRYEFLDELPRLPTGKLYKRKLRDAYWHGRDRAI
ncbi:AMP-binding protein [Actinomarinicola tropica]|uniref:AMP-binding protein n=1 Tax=Actinomarinicola tropica TaxID=2789776 RepID=A0A5Q2REI7_9ACTN|nr:AMP-binding protein [Actinomarinicola tropica]QGG94024.1 AMP-binding protein [Actinomarinicola tropica]